jgi:hypothetical protein
VAGGNVVYVDAEAVPQLQNARAEAWGMDRSRLFLMLPPEAYGMIDFGDEDCQNTLVQMCYELAPHLVVVDSLSAISARGENTVEDVREVLGFLASVAREFDVGMLLVHHLRKKGKLLAGLGSAGPVGLDELRGSGHIIAMARSVLALSPVRPGAEGDRNGPRRLEVIKTNLCRYPEPLGVAFEEGASGKEGAPVLRYSEHPDPPRPPTQAEECARWLVEVMEQAGGPVKPKEIVRLAKEAGFGQRLLYRARKALEGTVVDTGTKFAPGNEWRLAEQ